MYIGKIWENAAKTFVSKSPIVFVQSHTALSESFQMKVLDSSDRMTTSQQNELLLLKIIRPQ